MEVKKYKQIIIINNGPKMIGGRLLIARGCPSPWAYTLSMYPRISPPVFPFILVSLSPVQSIPSRAFHFLIAAVFFLFVLQIFVDKGVYKLGICGIVRNGW